MNCKTCGKQYHHRVGTTAANTQTDTLTINGGGIASTAISGDTLTITATEAQQLFNTMNTPSGTDPVADGLTDTLNFTAGTGVTITGDSGTDTIDISVADTSATNELQNVFQTISVSGQSDVVTDANSDTLTLVAGANVSITTTPGTDSITINATDTNTTYTADNGLTLATTTFKLGGALTENTTITADGTEVLTIENQGTGNSFVVKDQGTDTTPFVIDASGNVGIGTTTPGYKLDINGDARIASGSDLYIGAIGLNDTGSATTSGAYLIGTFDEFDNSSAPTVQGVLKDFDSILTSATGGAITGIGDVTSGEAFTSAGTQGTSLWFYDAQGRGQLTIDNLTQARTYTLPDATGEISVLGQTIGLNTSEVTGTLGETNGGTGESTYTIGDILYSDATNSLAKLGIGTSGYVLTSNGTIPQWTVLPTSDNYQYWTYQIDSANQDNVGSTNTLNFNAGNDIDIADTSTRSMTVNLESTLDIVSTINLAGTGTITGLDSIDATSESTLESTLDIGGDVTGTGLRLSNNLSRCSSINNRYNR